MPHAKYGLKEDRSRNEIDPGRIFDFIVIFVIFNSTFLIF